MAGIVLLVDHGHYLVATLQRTGFRFQPERHGKGSVVERILLKENMLLETKQPYLIVKPA